MAMVTTILNSPLQSIQLSVADRSIGVMEYAAYHGSAVLYPLTVNVGGDQIVAELDGVRIRDRISARDGYIVIDRSWIIHKPGAWRLGFLFTPSASSLDQWLVPSVMYQENVHGTGDYPRGGIDIGWSFREDRIPIPSCSVLYNHKSYCAVFTEPAKSENHLSSVRTFRAMDSPAFEISVPYSEAPASYRSKGILLSGMTKGGNRSILLRKGQLPFEYRRTFYIRQDDYTGNIFRAVADIALFAVNEFSETPAGTRDINWDDNVRLRFHNLRYLLVDDASKGITGIQMGKGNEFIIQLHNNCVAGSFLVKSLEAGTIFARFGIEGDDAGLCGVAERIGRFFLGGQLPNGLHRDQYQLSGNGWESFIGLAENKQLRFAANARCNGEVMTNYLRLYRLLKQRGTEIPEFRKIAEANADFYITHQLTGDNDGCFGRWWGPEGDPVDTRGTNGAYIISLLVELEKVVGNNARIDQALARAARYYGRLVDTGSYYGDTLDADCMDKEAGVALLRAFLDLYERDGDPAHLAYARDAASFVLTWMWTYDIAFDPQSAVGKYNFASTGLTAVSVSHHHLDFYGMFIAYDFLRLWQASGDDRWSTFARILIDSCAQLVATPGNLLGRSTAFLGWQPEQINNTDWDYFFPLHLRNNKGRFHNNIGWSVVLNLGAMLDIRERFPDMLSFAVCS